MEDSKKFQLLQIPRDRTLSCSSEIQVSLERTLQEVDVQAREGPRLTEQTIRSSDPRDFSPVQIGNMFLFSLNLYV